MLEPLVKSGKVRALALFATERSPLLPDLPTSAELGYPGMLMSNWYGMLAPAGLPADLQAKLEKAMLEAMKLGGGESPGGRRGGRRHRRQGIGRKACARGGLLGVGAQESSVLATITG